MKKLKKILSLFFFLSVFYSLYLYINARNRKSSEIKIITNEVEATAYLYVNDRQNQIYNSIYSHNRFEHQVSAYKEVIPRGRSKSSLNKKFYLIYEGVKFYGQTKFCHMKYDDGFLEPNNSDSIENKIFADNQAKNTERFFYLDGCLYKNCLFTCDSSLANVSDAILFESNTLYYSIKDQLSENNNIESVYKNVAPVSQRDESQLWIFWNDEANNQADALNGLNPNWTISFKSNSEASYCSYGCYSELDAIKTGSNISLIQNEFKQRENKAVWFVSNCNSKKRNSFAMSLSKHFNTEIYGKCSDVLKSINPEANLMGTTCERDTECETNLFKNTKFYFAFENSNCSDYITEKFWRSLDFGLVPIILHPSKEYYKKIAPPKSFIHAADFDYDPVRLAQYLTRVSNNFELYLKHRKWSLSYKVEYLANKVETVRMCELCYKLNTESSTIYYKNYAEWSGSGCAN